MAAIDTHNALHARGITGTARLALLVMALHADHRSRVAMSARDLGRMCAVSPQAASSAVQSLADKGLVQVVERGKGTAPSVYLLLAKSECCGCDQCCNHTDGFDPEEEEARLLKNPLARKAVRGLERIVKEGKAAEESSLQGASVKPAPATPAPASVKVDAAPPPDAPKPHIGPALPPAYPQNDVGRVLHAAGIQIDPMVPFYWHSGAHKRDLESLIAAAGSLDAALSRLQSRKPDVGGVRRLTALEQHVRGAR